MSLNCKLLPDKGYGRLEPDVMKVASPVLRRGRASNRSFLFGKNNALLRCNTCTHCFSETKGTIFFGLKTPDEEVLRTLAMIPEKGSIRGTARATKHDKDTVCRWLDIAGAHCQEVTDYFFQELELGQVQIDEIWSYIKKRKKT